MFIGRKAELKFLEDKYHSNKGQLIVLYGRRRVGKTETLREFCKDKPHIFYSCRECTDKLQLKSFSTKILKEDIPAAKYVDNFNDWETAFRAILELPSNDSKRLIIIDEFPYMCNGNSSIPSILQNLWDETLCNEEVMIILCGSAMSFIEKELLAEKNPLYGRATGIYKMKELGFYDAIKFFPHYSDRDKILTYSVLGGIPHYLKQFNYDLSLSDNIKNNILSKGSVLYSEVEFLLRQELRETSNYNAIIEAIALGSTKLNEISAKALIDDTSKTSVYLKNLIELEIVEREFSVSDGIREHSNLNRGLYRLTDNYFRFWYHYIFSNYSELEAGDIDGVYKYSIEPQLHEFASFVFEDICREYMRELQKLNKLPFRYSKLGRWWGKTTNQTKDKKLITTETEIDVFAVDKASNHFIIGECKFKGKPFSYSELASLKSKFILNREDIMYYYYLFSESGFDDKINEEARINNDITLVTMEDILLLR